MTKFYRIKVGSYHYVAYVAFNNTEEGLILEPYPTLNIDDAAIYEEDKAKRYCEELNNTERYKKAKIIFYLEEVD